MPSAKKILYVVNGAAFFSRRLAVLAKAAENSGYEVHVATPDGAEAGRIAETGFHFHKIPFTRSGVGPWSEFKTYLELESLYRRLKPCLVHHFTIKPVIYGGIAARRTGVPAVVSTITGLGFVFSSRHLKARLLKLGLLPWYRMALNPKSMRVVFQNDDDRTLFLKRGLVKGRCTALIHGTGVDISRFTPVPEPEGRPLVLFASRMLVEKGAALFVETAKTLQSRGVEARFVLVGDPDPGYPRSISRPRLRAWGQSKEVEWWGCRTDMPEVLASSSLVCFPSHYGEGVPRILVEAAASAKGRGDLRRSRLPGDSPPW